MNIQVDDLTHPDLIHLLQVHLQDAAKHSPAESIHALDLEGLRNPNITFWSARQGSELLGCCALKELDPQHGEIKSMRTAALHLRKGVAASLMDHLINEARSRGYKRLSLETGSMEAFAPARALYASFGFTACPAFASYVDDPYSVFMAKQV